MKCPSTGNKVNAGSGDNLDLKRDIEGAKERVVKDGRKGEIDSAVSKTGNESYAKIRSER